MARYKIILAYDGTEFYGSQRQAEARTVQQVVETALKKLGWQGQSILFAGRTDSGVHASGQVAAVDLNWQHPTEALLRALNATLPKDVAARAVTVVPPDFHPRFDAISRTYRYEILCDPVRQPLKERYVWRIWPALDLELLQSSAQALVGVHDFAPFGRAPRPGGGTIREIHQADWQQQGEGIIFKVTANAFLYHMVRRMVSVQVMLAQGRLRPGRFSQALAQPQSQPIFQGLAPSQGLSLVEVCYPVGSSENN